MNEQERLWRQFERNKEKLEQNRKKRQTTQWTKIAALSAFILTSVGGAVFTGSTKPVDEWITSKFALGYCAAKDRFLVSNESPNNFTIVILPLQNDEAAEAKRREISAALLTNYGANVVLPCTEVKLRNSGDAELAKQDLRRALKDQLKKYDADLVIFGSVSDGKLHLYGVTVDSVDGFNMGGGARTVAPDDSGVDRSHFGVAFEDEMINAAAYRVNAIQCSEIFLVGCFASSPLQEATKALTKTWTVLTRVVGLATPGIGDTYRTMLLDGFSLALNMADNSRTIRDSDGRPQKVYDVAKRLALQLSDDFSNLEHNDFWLTLAIGQIRLKIGEECNDIRELRLAGVEFAGSVKDLDAQERGSLLRPPKKIEQIFARLLLARAQSDLLARVSSFEQAIVMKELQATMSALTDGAKVLDQQLELERFPAANRDQFRSSFNVERQRLMAISTATTPPKIDNLQSATAISSSCVRDKPL
jgi:hypothetical protein